MGFLSSNLEIWIYFQVGITQWLQFLRFTVGAKDYQSFPHSKPEVDAMRFDTLQERVQMKILNGMPYLLNHPKS